MLIAYDHAPIRSVLIDGLERVFVPVFCPGQDFIGVRIADRRLAEEPPGVVEERNGGRYGLQWIAHEVDDARIGKGLEQRFDLCAK